MPADAFEIRFTTNISLLKRESGISKKYLSSTLCTENKPASDTALEVITSLYGLGPLVEAGVVRRAVSGLAPTVGCAMAATEAKTAKNKVKVLAKDNRIYTGFY